MNFTVLPDSRFAIVQCIKKDWEIVEMHPRYGHQIIDVGIGSQQKAETYVEGYRKQQHQMYLRRRHGNIM